MVGSKAASVLYHREKVMEMNGARSKALDEYRNKGSEQAKLNKEAADKAHGQISTDIEGYWKKHVDGPQERFKDFSKPVDGDDAGNKLLEQGYARAKEAFSILNPYDPKLTTQQRERAVSLHGAAYNWMAWGPRLAHQKNQLQSRVKELETKLAEFEASEPGPGSGGKAKGGAKAPETWEQQLESLAR
jgi:hypothetical protein